ncbi:MAG: transporter substrate-binding domain-containing protein [Verrucomicrobiales bacterium]|nr:transporter substrate-binding domain-containing protein [Verrucomicrobiales bacterium]
MKKRLLALTLGTLAMLAACSKQSPSAPSETAAEGEAPAPLRIGMDATYPPFEFVDPQGEISGVSVELGRAIGQQLDRPVQFQNLPFDGLITALKSGAIDLIISSMTETEERAQSVRFSRPYVKTGLSILAAQDAAVHRVEDLQKPGTRVAVRIGTTGESWSQSHLPDAKLIRLDSDAACVLEVINGTVEAWVYDQVSVMNYHRQHPQRTRALLAPLREEFWAVAMRRDAPAELEQGVNAAIHTLQTEGGMERIADQYLKPARELMQQQGLPFVFDLD